ncbi:MAG: hypothetical protein WEB00_06125 [Dehalococcoidia bacterium]
MEAALLEVIAPEMQSSYAQHTLETMVMTVESVVQELESSAANLPADIQTMLELLEQLAVALQSGPPANDTLAAAALGDGVLPGGSANEIHTALLARLEAAIVELEKLGDNRGEALETVRADIYLHLRDVTSRGWSFWDMLSFRASLASSRARVAG